MFLGELRIEARSENLRIISYFIAGIGQRLKLTEKTLFDVELALEEAAVNIVTHAYPEGHHGDILLVVEAFDELLKLTLTDWGIPLDPENVQPFDLNAPVEARIRGGMGLYFINTLMDEVTRNASSELGSPNTLTLTKHIEMLETGVKLPSALRERNAMLSISQLMMSDVDLDELLMMIINELVDVIGAERGTLYLIDEENDEIYSKVLLELTGELTEIRMKIGEGLAGYVARTGEVVNIQDAYQDVKFQQAFDQKSGFVTRTMLVVPLRNHQHKIIGVVQLLNKRGGYFTSRDERLLNAMAAQAAMSIENARLYAQEVTQKLINQDLKTAHSIQASFLPDQLPDIAGWDIDAVWKTMHNVGGDFYDFFQLPDGRLAILVADVSGKGVPAALFMAYSETVLRFAMSLDLSPAQMLTRANEFILSNQKSKMFTTVFVAYLNPKDGKIVYASAGHNPPIRYRSNDDTYQYLEAKGVALGVFGSAQYVDEYVQLHPRDVLLIYTDGLVEAIDESEAEFGEVGVIDVLQMVKDSSCKSINYELMNSVRQFARDEGGVFDDITIVALKQK